MKVVVETRRMQQILYLRFYFFIPVLK